MPWRVKFLRACSRQCRNNLHIDSTYIHTYRLIQKTMCRIHIHILCTHSVLLRHTYSYQYTLYTVCTHFYILYTYIHTIICEGAADYTFAGYAIYIYIYTFSRRFYPKRLIVHSGYTFVLSVCVFPGNRTHSLCAANAMF